MALLYYLEWWFSENKYTCWWAQWFFGLVLFHDEVLSRRNQLAASTLRKLCSEIWRIGKYSCRSFSNAWQTFWNQMMLCSRQNTSSMIRHLERRHNHLFIQFLQQSGNQVRASSFISYSADWDEIRFRYWLGTFSLGLMTFGHLSWSQLVKETELLVIAGS